MNIGYLRELPEGERIGGSLQAQDSGRGYGVLTICLKILYNTNRFFAVGTMHCNFAFFLQREDCGSILFIVLHSSIEAFQTYRCQN